MKIVFFGTSEFAVSPLQGLIKCKHELVLVITQPKRQRGRGLKLLPTAVESYAKDSNIEVVAYEDVNSKESIANLREKAADLFVVVDFGQILSDELLAIPKLCPINIHASLLPRYRGAAPVQYAIINGDKETGVTIMEITKKLDSGDIIAQAKTQIKVDEDARILRQRLARLGSELLIETLDKIELKDAQFLKQDESKVVYASKLKKEDGHIDWNKDAFAIKNLIRGSIPWPSAYAYLEGKILKIYEADILAETFDEAPGTVVRADDEEILISCAKNAISIKELQLEGKKVLSVEEFLRGHKVTKGSVFK